MLLLGCALLVGCATRGPVSDGAEVARAYLDAVARGDGEAAWALLSSSARRAVPRGALRRRVAGLAAERRSAHRPQERSVQAKRHDAVWGSGERRMAFEYRGDGTWMLTSPPPAFDRTDTPLAALRTFGRAIARMDWELAISLAPASARDGLDAGALRRRFEAGAFRKETLDALGDLERSAGKGHPLGTDRWRFESSRHRADLVLEAGHWRLLDLR